MAKELGGDGLGKSSGQREGGSRRFAARRSQSLL